MNLYSLLFILFLTFLINISTATTAAARRCRKCEYNGRSRDTLTRFEVQLSSCRSRQCFCRCDGAVVCPDNLHRQTCKDDCIPCWNPFTWTRLPPFATFRSSGLACECGCLGTYSCSST